MEFIYINKNSLSKEICEDIIFLYDKDELLGGDGVTFAGVNKDIKNSWDINIGLMANNSKNKEWIKIHELLYSELYRNLKTYLDELSDNKEYNKFLNESSPKFKIINMNPLKAEVFQLQKYEINSGKYIYHQDGLVSLKEKQYRIITYLWYINDVYEGGETEFFGNLKIKPEEGKLILFPATWTYPHCACMPISNPKFIITGWINVDMP